MKTLQSVLEGLLDRDFDVTDSQVLVDSVIQKAFIDVSDDMSGSIENGVLTVYADTEVRLNKLPPDYHNFY